MDSEFSAIMKSTHFTKFYDILCSGLKEVALTNYSVLIKLLAEWLAIKWTDWLNYGQDKIIVPPQFVARDIKTFSMVHVPWIKMSVNALNTAMIIVI